VSTHLVPGSTTYVTVGLLRRVSYRHSLTAILLVSLACLGGAAARSGATPRDRLPAGFHDRLLATLPLPTAMAFTPDRRLLIATQRGLVRVMDEHGHVLRAPALDFRSRVCNERERGMTGIAVDPDFLRNRFVYVYYTFKKFNSCAIESPRGPVNRLSRFVLRRDSTLDPATELPLIDNVPSWGATHNAGDVQFGPDGYIYVGIGDGGRDYAGRSDSSAENAAARDLNVLLGKIVRITPTGAVPPGNPFRGPGTVACARLGVAARGSRCAEIYASGLRNPWRLAFDPARRQGFFINDVGQTTWEEIDRGRPGADYGWNLREGFCQRDLRVRCSPAPVSVTDPVFAYAHRDGCGAITGGAFVPAGTWPPRFDHTYLFGDFNCGRIFELSHLDGRPTSAQFAPGVGPGIVSMVFGHGGALYYATYAAGGEIRRITYDASPR
jgi:glucose/arabinose dehydrogenase